MVTTVTLSPSLDKTYIIDEIKEDILNYADKTVLFPGSKGINVSRLLSKLKIENRAIGLNGGAFGPLLEQLIELEGVKHDFTPCDANVRFNVKIMNLNQHTFTDVNERGEAVTQKEWDAFLADYRGYLKNSSYVVLAGSLRKGMANDTYASLTQIANSYKVPVFLDCCGSCLKETLSSDPYLIAPNIHELEDCLQTELKSIPEIVYQAKRIQENGISHVIVTLGPAGAVWVNNEGVYKMTPPSVKTLNTTGAGDSFLAGILYGMMNQQSIEEILKIAGSVSTAKVVREDTGMPENSDLFRYFNNTKVEKID